MGDLLTPISGSEANLVLGCNFTADANDVSPSGLAPSLIGSPSFDSSNGVFLDNSNYITFPGNIGSYGQNIRFNGSHSFFFFVKRTVALATLRFLTKTNSYLYYIPTTLIYRAIIYAPAETIYDDTSGEKLATTGDWVHIGYVCDTVNGFSFFVNGQLLNKIDTSTVSPVDTANVLEIGASAGANGLNGYMKGLEAYSVAFSNAEVLSLYNLRNTLTVPNPPENVNAYTTVGVDGAIFISWIVPSAGATPDSYNLYYSTSTPVTKLDDSITGLVIGDSPKIITGLTPGTKIFVAMESVAGVNVSDLSTEDSATPTGTAPAIPVITTTSQTIIYDSYGAINISGTCDTSEQLIKIQKDGSDIAPAVYVPALQGTFNALSIPVTSGSQTLTAKACSINLCSSASTAITITGVDKAVTEADANIESLIFAGLKTIIEDLSLNFIYQGEEKIMSCVELEYINEEFIEKFSCYSRYDIDISIACYTKDLFQFRAGQFDDTDLSDSKDGSVKVADDIRRAILSNWSDITQLTDLYHLTTEKIESDGEITGYRVLFKALYLRAN